MNSKETNEQSPFGFISSLLRRAFGNTDSATAEKAEVVVGLDHPAIERTAEGGYEVDLSKLGPGEKMPPLDATNGVTLVNTVTEDDIEKMIKPVMILPPEGPK